jgi:hypothetical protein
MKAEAVAACALIALFLLIDVVALLMPPRPKPVCVESVKVVEIIELKYRDAVIRTSDGKVRTVNQATMKPGDQLCARWSR